MKVQEVTQTNKFKQDSQDQTNPPNKKQAVGGERIIKAPRCHIGCR